MHNVGVLGIFILGQLLALLLPVSVDVPDAAAVAPDQEGVFAVHSPAVRVLLQTGDDLWQ